MRHCLAIIRSIAFAPSFLATHTCHPSHRPLPLAGFLDRKSRNAASSPSPPSSTPASAPTNDQMAMSDLDLAKLEKFARKRGDALFGFIEQCHVERSPPPKDGEAACFGRFLDAGTGSHSLRWMASIIHRDRLLADLKDGGSPRSEAGHRVSMASFTAITADENMRRRTREEAEELGILDKGEVIIGNWKQGVKVDEKGKIEFDSPNGGNEKALLERETFDTILVDYLVGAIDGFSPYFQDQIFHRLTPHLAPGGRMYVIGLQPIPDSVSGDANVFCKITKVRDACIKLANHRCYREYPLDWIERQIKRAGLEVVDSKKYPIRYDQQTMRRQINVGRSKLKLFPSEGLAREMGKVLDDLEKESLEATSRRPDGRITLGFDYVVVAEKPKGIVERLSNIL